MSRLQKLGAADTNLAPWGSDGQLVPIQLPRPAGQRAGDDTTF